MVMSQNDWPEIERLLSEMISQQKTRLLKCGRQIIPHVTGDDLLQPNDFPELENNPIFRYEEGVLAGIQMMEIALRALKNAQLVTGKEY